MISEFMLPSLGAFTINGTLILAVGVIAVVGLVFKYKDNISFSDENIVINKEENIKFEKNPVKKDNTNRNSVEKTDENLQVNEEKVKIFN